jgi:energy-coupling factor transport system permease protein
MVFGITISMRLLTLLIVIFTFTFTTSPREILKVFSFLPYEIAIMLMLSFRFVPLVKDEVAKIINAQKSRGLNFRSVNFFKTYFPILVPLFVKTLEGSNHLALAMESRGFEVK